MSFRFLIPLAGALALASAAAAQPAPAPEQAPGQAARPAQVDPKVRIAELEGDLARQRMIASNARVEVEHARAELKLKDELIVLGRTRNAELYAVAQEILARYAKADLGARLAVREPFVQASRVKLENLVQAYEDKLRAARVYESTLPPSVEARMRQDLAAAEAKAGTPADAAPAPAAN
jgi:hypothetical protein